MMTRRRALGELSFAGALWGFGFVATVWALRDFGPSELLVWRFLVAVAFAEIARFVWRKARGQAPDWKPHASDLRLSVPAGILLGSMLLTQTIGLQFTTASKSGFLTALYVIFVPLLAHFLLRRPEPARVYAYALLALAGAYFLMGADLTSLNPGDVWTIFCALLAALHILYIEKVSARIRDSFRFNTLQTLICLIAITPLLAFQTEIRMSSADPWVWSGILALAVGSTVIGFTIQLRAQKILSPTTASMLFLLESPFALIFGVLLLQESFGLFQAIGAVLISLAALLTTRADRDANSR